MGIMKMKVPMAELMLDDTPQTEGKTEKTAADKGKILQEPVYFGRD